MAQVEKDLTSGRLSRQILFFSLPLMASNVLQVLFNMSDIAVVGRFGGANSLGAVGSTTTLVTLFTGLLIGMGSGINVIVAHSLGAHHDQDTREATHTALLLSLFLGLFVTAFCQVFTPFLLGLLHTKADLMPGAVLYLRIYSLGFPALALYNFANAVYSAAGNTKKPLYFLTASGILNVILNLFFVIVCGLDVAGVALASIISQYLTALLIILSLFRCPAVYGLALSHLHLSQSHTRRILALGLSAGLQNSIFAMANLFIQSGVNQFSTIVVAGNSAAANADPLVYDVMTAFYIACASFIGQNYGAHNLDRIMKSYFISLGYSFAAGAILGVLFLLFGHAFLSLFATDPQVIQAGMARLTIMSFSYCVSAFMDCTIAAARGLGKSLIPTAIVIAGSCVFRIIWVYTIFAYFGTIESLYLLYICSWSITALAEILYFRHCLKAVRASLRPAAAPAV